MNVTVVEPGGCATKLNEPGPVLTSAEIAALVAATTDAATNASWVVDAKLPPVAPTELHAALVAAVRRLGVRVAIDLGVARRRRRPAPPHQAQPMRNSLNSSAILPTLADVRDAARDLVAEGIGDRGREPQP